MSTFLEQCSHFRELELLLDYTSGLFRRLSKKKPLRYMKKCSFRSTVTTCGSAYVDVAVTIFGLKFRLRMPFLTLLVFVKK